MSSLSRVRVVRLDKIYKHPNADTLDIAEIDGMSVVVKSNQYRLGDLVTYVPCDMIAPEIPELAFLGDKRRIRATKLRGIVSNGLVFPVRPGWEENQDVTDELGFQKYEFFETASTFGDFERPPSGNVVYTDIENLRKYKDIIKVGTPVVLTEKLHGAASRFVYQDNKLHIGSRTSWFRSPVTTKDTIWHRVATKYNLEEKLKEYPNIMIMGETYGWVQNLRYGHNPGNYSLALYDIIEMSSGAYLNYNQFVTLAARLELPICPELYKGPWNGFDSHKNLAEGESTLAKNVREGFVVRPLTESYHDEVGRVILKCIGEGYKVAKD